MRDCLTFAHIHEFRVVRAFRCGTQGSQLTWVPAEYPGR
jgi:hypothetical protein